MKPTRRVNDKQTWPSPPNIKGMKKQTLPNHQHGAVHTIQQVEAHVAAALTTHISRLTKTNDNVKGIKSRLWEHIDTALKNTQSKLKDHLKSNASEATKMQFNQATEDMS